MLTALVELEQWNSGRPQCRTNVVQAFIKAGFGAFVSHPSDF